MGHTHANKPSMIEIPSGTQATIQVTGAAANKTLLDVEIPAYTGKLLAAYLTFEADNYYTDGASTVDGDQYIKVSDDGGSNWYNAILVKSGTIKSTGGNLYTNSIIIQGSTDIKAYCAPGGTLNIQWTAAKTVATVDIYTIKLRLILIFA
jgi:hypothetical protein